MHLLIFPLLFISFYQESQPKPSVRFFECDLLTLNLLNTEKFSLGDVEEGELIKIQVLIRNRTKQKLSFGDKLQTGKVFRIVEPVFIEEGDTGLLRGELQVNSEFVNANGEFEVGIRVTKESTIFLKFHGDISGVARFEQENIVKRINRIDMGHPEIRFRLPVTLSKDQNMNDVKFSADSQFAFVKFKLVSESDRAYVELSLPSRMLENRKYKGRLYVSNVKGTVRRSTNLFIERVDDIQLLPKVVVFKRAKDSLAFTGEAILRITDFACDITEVRLDFNREEEFTIDHRLERLTSDTARIYLSITPKAERTMEMSKIDFEIVATDGLKEADTVFKVFVSNR
jgi:hypothetical protein